MDKTTHERQSATARARFLRQRQTPAESQLWAHLRDRQLRGFKFRRQHPLGNFVVDFYCPARKLVVEIDGDIHAGQSERDAGRTEWLEKQGCRVLRFTNREVMTQLQAVLETILRECLEEDWPSPQPSPWKDRRGSWLSPHPSPWKG